MNDLTLNSDKRMTVAEVATVLGVSPEAIRKHIRALYPGMLRHGEKTMISEIQVSEIKRRMQQSTKVVSATTDYEMIQKMLEVESWLKSKLQEAEIARDKAERTVAILSHVRKTYTTTEVAKELGMKSAQQLNERLHAEGIQYQQNKTWIPYAQYADLGYFDIKQEVLDSGHVIYHRRITQIGREFILKLFGGEE